MDFPNRQSTVDPGQLFTKAELNRYERLLASNTEIPESFRHALIKAFQNARLQNQEGDQHHQVIWDTAVHVIAPVLVGFVHWCLVEAQKRNIQRLYFVARDGQILYRIAQVLCRDWNYVIDCRYLYASRQSLHFPAIQQLGATELDWILCPMDFLSVEIICERVNLKPEQIGKALIQTGFPKQAWGENLNQAQREAIKPVFSLPSVLDLICNQAAIYRSRAIGYFCQEGLADGVPFAIVDTGWSGRSHRSLSRLLELGEIDLPQGLIGFYFGLKQLHRVGLTDQLIPYFLDSTMLNERFLLSNNDILELFLAADHGSTMRYEKEGNRYVPILRSEKNEAGLAWGLMVQQRAIVTFAEHLLQCLQPEDCETYCFHIITERLLEAFIFSPSKHESEVFGSLVFSQQQSDSKFYTLAPIYKLTDCIKILTGLQKVHDFAWLPASIKRSSWKAKLPLLFLKRTKLGFIYAYLAFRNFEKGDMREGYRLFRKAFIWSPAVIFSNFFAQSIPIMIQSLFRKYRLTY